MPRSQALVTIGPMPTRDAEMLLSDLSNRGLHGANRLAVVTGFGETGDSLRETFNGAELDELIRVAAACWYSNRDGLPGRPTLTPVQARLTMRAFWKVNRMGTPSDAELQSVRSGRGDGL